jgi:hypothetical protein
MVDTTAARALVDANLPDNDTGDISAADLRAVFDAALDAVDTAGAPTGPAQIAGELTAPGNRSYVLELSAPYAYTIDALAVQTAAGTATCAVQVNGANVTGLSAVAASTTLATGTATAANAVAVGNKVTLAVSAVAGASELAFSLRYTRT